MSKILVAGLCPLPFENTLKTYGPGIRTWQFAWSLSQAGHEVILLAMVTPGVYEGGEIDDAEVCDGVSIVRLSGEDFLDPSQIKRLIEKHQPDAVVGATIYGSFALARTEPTTPFWADQFGHVMAEAQAKAALEGANWPLAHWWKMVAPVLRKADRVSTVSERQRYAAIGELGALGRLSAETCGYEFTSVIPCALMPPRESHSGQIVRGELVPENAFVVLWGGGYNVWSAVDTLFEGMELAMAEEPKLRFVSTGGEIAGHDTDTYACFQRLVEASAHRDRFHLQGWVSADLVPNYVAEANVGVLTEKLIYEGQLGSKNRIIQWMGAGLPVIYNRVGDLGDLLAERNLGLTFDPCDPGQFCEKILWASREQNALAEMGAIARQVVEREFSCEATTRELVRWIEDPTKAPDSESRQRIRSPLDFGGLDDKLSMAAQGIPAVRNSRRLRTIWRRFRSSKRS